MPASSRPAHHRLVLAVLAVLAPAAVLASCGLPTNTPHVVDFIQLDDRRYVRVDGGVVEAPADTTLGPEVAYTSRTVGDPKGKPIRSGDAAYLDPGTALRAVPGFEPWFRLAAVLPDDKVALYELADRTGARRGDDVLDLAPGVTEVAVQRDDGGSLGETTNPAVIDDLVHRLLALPAVTGTVQDERPDLVLELRFGNGLSPVRRAVFAKARSLGDQLQLDDRTLCSIETIAGRPCTAPGSPGIGSVEGG
jgi:hypothetical protein